MAFGFAVASRSWILFVFLAVLFVIIYVPTILSEEVFLRSTFLDFAAYERRVPRLFPRLTPAVSTTPVTAGGFSISLYRRHREYNAALGAIAIYAALLARLLLWQQRH
jgi:hypothetical protein